MDAKIMFQSYHKARFLERFNRLMSLELKPEAIVNLASLPESIDRIPSAVLQALLKSGIVTLNDSKYYITLPVLTPDFSNRLAESISAEIKDIAGEAASLIDDTMPGYLRHYFLGTLVLGYLWPSMLFRKVLQGEGGSAVILIEPQSCATLYIDSIGIGGGGLVTWIQTSLQNNNAELERIFKHRDVVKTLSSVNSEGDITPFGEAADILYPFKIVNMIRRRDDYLSSYVLAKPQVSTEIITELKPLLSVFANMGIKVIDKVAAMSESAYTSFATEWKIARQESCFHAFYYVFCYELMRQWELLGVIPKWRRVPNCV